MHPIQWSSDVCEGFLPSSGVEWTSKNREVNCNWILERKFRCSKQASSQGNPGHVPTSQVSKLKTSHAPWESALIPRVDAHWRRRPMGLPSTLISQKAMLEMSLVPRESGTCTNFPSVDAQNERSFHNNCELFLKRINLLILNYSWNYSMS